MPHKAEPVAPTCRGRLTSVARPGTVGAVTRPTSLLLLM
jgi:hypothetical protein